MKMIWIYLKNMPIIWSKENVKIFVDVFGGSGTVSMNLGYENVTINENKNKLVYITIIQAKLRTKEGFEKYKNYYNKPKRNSIDVFLFEKFIRYSTFNLDKKGNYKEYSCTCK